MATKAPYHEVQTLSFGLDRAAPTEGPIVKGFRDGGFLVADRWVPGGLVLTPDAARDWKVTDLDSLAAEDAVPFASLDPRPEFLLLGTGDAMRRPPPAFVTALETVGIGIEPMDSRAAARAWGLLRSEGRWIAAALLPL